AGCEIPSHLGCQTPRPFWEGGRWRRPQRYCRLRTEDRAECYASSRAKDRAQAEAAVRRLGTDVGPRRLLVLCLVPRRHQEQVGGKRDASPALCRLYRNGSPCPIRLDAFRPATIRGTTQNGPGQLPGFAWL